MNATLAARLNQILPRVTSAAFLSSEGISNEIAFYIFDYPAEDELQVREHIQVMLGRLASHHADLRVLHLNLLGGRSGLPGTSRAKESVKVGFDYFCANASQIQASLKVGDHDYHLHVVEAHNTGPSTLLTLSAFVALCSALVGKALESQMVVLGTMSLGGNIVPVENLAESLQVAADAGAKRLLLPVASVGDIPTIPGELFAKFQTSFYADPRDAVFKALGVL